VNTTDLTALVKQLSDVHSIAGDEIAMRRTLRPLVEPHCETLRVDAMGNLIAYKPGTGDSPLRVMLAAHMDEVGLMVVDYTSDGCLRISASGGIDDRLLPGLEVRVGPEGLPGIIGLEPVHLAKSTDSVATKEQLAVDIGASGKDEAKRLAPVGTRITFATQSRDLSPETLAGKAFDDRAGCALLVHLLQGAPLPCDLYGVFTVQEEVGLRGAGVAAYAIEPDIAIALEGTIADDLPKEEDVSPTSQVGHGPVITVMDRSYAAPPRLVRYLVETAERLDIPYQFKQPGIGGTDAGSIHRVRQGIPCATIAVPCRYIHSPISLMNTADLEHTATLLRAALDGLTPALLQPAR